MIRRAIAAASIAWLACGGSPAPTAEAARETLRAYLEASQVEDWETMHALVAPESLEGQTREQFVAERRRLASPVSRAIQERTEVEIGAVEIEGDRARARIDLRMPDLAVLFTPGGRPSAAAVEQAPLREAEQTLELVWTGEGWRVLRPRPVRPGRAEVERLRQRLDDETDRVVEDLVRQESRAP